MLACKMLLNLHSCCFHFIWKSPMFPVWGVTDQGVSGAAVESPERGKEEKLKGIW